MFPNINNDNKKRWRKVLFSTFVRLQGFEPWTL